MCRIIFLRIIILSFQIHQSRILNAGLMAWNRYGLSCTYKILIRKYFVHLLTEYIFRICEVQRCDGVEDCPKVAKRDVIRSKAHLKVTLSDG